VRFFQRNLAGLSLREGAQDAMMLMPSLIGSTASSYPCYTFV